MSDFATKHFVLLVNVISLCASFALIIYGIVYQLPHASGMFEKMQDKEIMERFDAFKIYYVGIMSFAAGLFPNYATGLAEWMSRTWPGKETRSLLYCIGLAVGSLVIGIYVAGVLFKQWVVGAS